MQCKVCAKDAVPVFQAKILGKYQAQYFHCRSCSYLTAENPFWLEEAYHDPINLTDTGILERNLYAAEKSAVLIYSLFDKNAIFLDYAGGHGILARRMRDIGFDYYTQDLYTPNILAKGFDYRADTGDIELITTFESFEHFVQPREEIEKMLAISKSIFFSTWLLPDPIPKPDDWWYYGLEHGQHISFYSKQTLEYLAGKYNLNFYSNGSNLHLITVKKVDGKKFNKILKNSGKIFYKKVRKVLKSRTVTDMDFLRSELKG